MPSIVVNEFSSPELAVATLTSPEQVKPLRDHVADTLNQTCGPPTIVDLSDAICDIRIESAAQGASFIEVDLIDPTLKLFVTGFITTDADGFLYPPVQLEFPPNSDRTWQLVAARPSTDVSGMANTTLTFEDSIVSAMRDVDAGNGGVNMSAPNETLAGWMSRLVRAVNRVKGTHIELVQMISPVDPNYTAPSIPSTAQQQSTGKTPSHYAKKRSRAHQSTVAAALAAAQSDFTRVAQDLGAGKPQASLINSDGPYRAYIPGLGSYEPTSDGGIL